MSDLSPGIGRRRAGRGFVYVSGGRIVREAQTLSRIRKLAIPPAWREVWICPSADGHIQATGRDARGRKQYRYHAQWRAQRDETKYERLLAFGAALPRIRKAVARDLDEPGLPRSKVLATVVALLELTLMRVGNVEYARANGSYGLTTLRNDHVDILGSTLRFEFRGKSGKMHRIEVADRRLARIVRECRDTPGHELFQYVDDAGVRRAVASSDVNAYIREAAGEEFSAKDFRTWAGTVLALRALRLIGPAESPGQARRNVVRAIDAVAHRLRNTPAICRKSYVHPAVIDAYLDGELIEIHKRARSRGVMGRDEVAVLSLLRHRAIRQDAPGSSPAARPRRASRAARP